MGTHDGHQRAGPTPDFHDAGDDAALRSDDTCFIVSLASELYFLPLFAILAIITLRHSRHQRFRHTGGNFAREPALIDAQRAAKSFALRPISDYF